MKTQVAKWGNSLAVRIPAECVRTLGLKAGDSVEAEVTSAGELRLSPPSPVFNKAAFLQRLQALREELPISDSVIEELRRDERY